uniref:Uncharacterized protein n=1 Tax=Lotus japonicus TaxID=34305 RepID=I3S865_LOTJA|nr:unknown [Lotus japonicus]
MVCAPEIFSFEQQISIMLLPLTSFYFLLSVQFPKWLFLFTSESSQNNITLQVCINSGACFSFQVMK